MSKTVIDTLGRVQSRRMKEIGEQLIDQNGSAYNLGQVF